ncbi:MAG: tetratricopeptide (TPR) repeat protein [Glaciecola sp.]|jgi:tetratricopeptide (TPR) repeat protein
MLALFTSIFVSGQSKAKVSVLMASASQKFLGNDYWGALDAYRSAQKLDEGNAKINYKIADCHYHLKHYKYARQYFEEAEKLDPNIDKNLHLSLGQTYHRLEELTLAIEHFKKYRKVAPERDITLYDVNGLIKQCEYAGEMMKNPLDVKIDNLGRAINSRFDDYAPSLSSDGTIMMFTSRRAGMTHNAVDTKGDYKYFEDIFVAERDDMNSSWGQSERLDALDTDGHDAVLSISPKATEIFIYKNNINSAGDIFKSSRESLEDEWSEPKKLPKPINTTYFESSISITADGSTMYFISERPKNGLGRGDIYVTRKTGDDSWSKPTNLGSVINTPKDEKFVFVHPNGSTIFFASAGHLTMGSYDIFKSELMDGQWTTPVNLGYPINTVNEESTFSMTADNKKLLISAEYENTMGERDIYEIDLSNIDILDVLNIDSELLEAKANVLVYGTLKVEKYDKNIRNADITFLNAKTEEVIYKITSDKEGAYEVSLPFGETYLMRINSEKYGLKEEKIKLKERDGVGSELKLDVLF